MATKAFRLQIFAICASLLGIILLIVAMASPSWIVGCVLVFGGSLNVKSCLHQGLYKYAISTDGTLQISIETKVWEIPAWIVVGGISLSIAIILSFISVMLHLLVIIGSPESKIVSRVRIGLRLLVFAALFGIAGMFCYYGESSKVIHDYKRFFALMRKSARTPFGESDVSSWRRNPHLEMYGFNQVNSNGAHPEYGYAFSLGWIASVLFIVAAAAFFFAKRRLSSKSSQEESRNSQT